jgi:hypothetical protein
MLYHENLGPMRISLREVAVAWACCGFVALAALLGAAVDRRKEASLAMHAGVHIPGSGRMSVRSVPAGDESNDTADRETEPCFNRGKASVCPTLEGAAYSKLQAMSSAATC